MHNINAMPKLDLHCHLDGSLTIDFVQKALAQSGEDYHRQDLVTMLQVPEDCPNLTEYLKRFDIPLKCMQSTENLKNAAYTCAEQLSKEHIKYAEIRFAPTLSTAGGLTYKSILESVIDGFKNAQEDFGIYTNVIVCAMRQLSVDENLLMLKNAREYYGHGVCALDLAGDESSYPNGEHRYLFEKAKSLGLPFTIHAGECGSLESVRSAIEFGAKRIGHGIALAQSGDLQKRCKRQQIGIEMCPTSNFQTKAVQMKSDYPIRKFIENGMLVTVNTDNRTVSNTSITREFELLAREYGFSEEELKMLAKNAIEVCFASDEVKHMLHTVL